MFSNFDRRRKINLKAKSMAETFAWSAWWCGDCHVDCLLRNPAPGSGGDSVGVQIGRDEDSAAQLPANAKLVARNFRYMRRKPTIMAYKPPKGK